MLSLRNFWRRHKRKILITAGVLGSGYFLCKLYNAHQQKLADLERELARQRANDEIIKAQLQGHFENVQLIADTTSLPHAMQYLRARIAEVLDLSQLTERLQKGKGQPTTLTPSEKFELWDRLKILSFTQMLVSLWAVTMLSLYIKVQVNILGRHLYIDTARGLESSLLLVCVSIMVF
uniref:Peroxin-3 n=1 Tax=Salix viminalis TaxID=40686 RepID=A0A6N2KX51_SALVM